MYSQVCEPPFSVTWLSNNKFGLSLRAPFIKVTTVSLKGHGAVPSTSFPAQASVRQGCNTKGGLYCRLSDC